MNNSCENECNLSKNFNSLKNFFVREDSLNIAVKAKQRMVVHGPKKYYQDEEFKRRIEPADINACGNDNSNASESVSGMLSRSSEGEQDEDDQPSDRLQPPFGLIDGTNQAA